MSPIIFGPRAADPAGAAAAALEAANLYTDSGLFTLAADPGVNDDSASGYIIGSLVLNRTTRVLWEAISVGVGEAVWRPVRVLSNDELLNYAQGYLDQSHGANFDGEGGAPAILATGVQYFQMFAMRAGKTYTGSDLLVTTAASGLATAKTGLVSLDGTTLLAVSGNDNTNWSSGTGKKKTDFTTPYSPTVDGVAWLCWLFITGTMPIVVRGNASYDQQANGAFPRVLGACTGQSDLTATVPTNFSSVRPRMGLIGTPLA